MRNDGTGTSREVRAERVYNFIKGYLASNGESPSQQEIVSYFRIPSVAGLEPLLLILEERSLIRRVKGSRRNIEVL